MMAKKKKQESILFVLMGLIIMGLVVAGFILFKNQISEIIDKQKQQTVAQEALAVKQKAMIENQEKPEEYIPQEDVQIIQVYYGVIGKDSIESESKRVRKSKMLISQARQIVNYLLEKPGNERLYKLVPDGTYLRGLFYEAGVYTIDLSREFNNVLNYGPSEQILTVYSIVNSLTESDPKAKVRFLVNGTEMESEEGHVDFGANLTRLESIIEK